jgi:hypothetical protein
MSFTLTKKEGYMPSGYTLDLPTQGGPNCFCMPFRNIISNLQAFLGHLAACLSLYCASCC